MDGSTARKVLRVAGAHLRRPQDLQRYLANLRRPPLDSGLPWFTFGAIDFLAGWLEPHHRVFEYGCGGSTIFFAQRAAAVVCVEHSAKWRAATLHALAQRNLGNVLIGLTPAGREPQLAGSPYCRALDRPYDIMVVDGWAMGNNTDTDRRNEQSRRACFDRADTMAQPGNIIVLDEAWMHPDLSHKARERRSFRGVGPYRAGVSTTDVFFY